jgi:hypothetical protein
LRLPLFFFFFFFDSVLPARRLRHLLLLKHSLQVNTPSIYARVHLESKLSMLAQARPCFLILAVGP